MPGTHESHELTTLVAALILSIGGGAILVRAALERRAALDRVVPVRLAAGTPEILSGAERRSAFGAVRRAETLIVAGLSAGAAAIHLAAGPAHVEELGDLGLGFYWAALFQGLFAAAWLARHGSHRLASIGIVGNLAILGAWAWARTIGLPSIPGGPETIGVADSIAVLLQIGLVGLLAGRRRQLGASLAWTWHPARVRTATTSGLIAILGVVLLSTTIAVVDATSGHHQDRGAHAAADAPMNHGDAHAGPGTVLTIP